MPASYIPPPVTFTDEELTQATKALITHRVRLEACLHTLRKPDFPEALNPAVKILERERELVATNSVLDKLASQVQI